MLSPSSFLSRIKAGWNLLNEEKNAVSCFILPLSVASWNYNCHFKPDCLVGRPLHQPQALSSPSPPTPCLPRTPDPGRIPKRPSVTALWATPLGEVPTRRAHNQPLTPGSSWSIDLRAPLLDPKVRVWAAPLSHPMTTPQISPALPTATRPQARKSTSDSGNTLPGSRLSGTSTCSRINNQVRPLHLTSHKERCWWGGSSHKQCIICTISESHSHLPASKFLCTQAGQLVMLRNSDLFGFLGSFWGRFWL